jgi:hypothetical protein
LSGRILDLPIRRDVPPAVATLSGQLFVHAADLPRKPA